MFLALKEEKWRWPLEGGKGQEMESFLESPKRNAALLPH